ncbi:porin family protein [Dyadobacter sp. CY356]|uniref:porin family protein n=1 Tax=Dyadobacter sp. CY356 TaxID=2906442 RepID=UPI001F39FC7A|nr:porin family protein [Dyadobacter sp. CY356]MCF0055101.1 PorT family protein [Dyadobacter sp. CY356]
MKKCFVIAALFVFSRHSLLAQSKFYFDLQTGVSVSALKGGNSGNLATTNYKPGFTAGLGAGFKLSNIWSLQSGINYQSLGGGSDNTLIIPIQGYKKYFLNYTSIPVLVKLNFPKSNLGIFVGPQYGYLVSKKFETYSGYFESVNRLRKTDFAALLGAEYYFPLKTGNHIGLSFKYQFSVNKIDNFESDDLFIKNTGFILTIGYRFQK